MTLGQGGLELLTMPNKVVSPFEKNVCVCVRERERQRQRETDRERRERQRERESLFRKSYSPV